MQIHDRGSKKWTSLMLPEHVEALKELFAEQDFKEKPILDEQQLMKNEIVLQHALHHDQAVEIKYYQAHDIHVIKGKMLFINKVNNYLLINHVEIKLNNIIEVNEFHNSHTSHGLSVSS